MKCVNSFKTILKILQRKLQKFLELVSNKPQKSGLNWLGSMFLKITFLYHLKIVQSPTTRSKDRTPQAIGGGNGRLPSWEGDIVYSCMRMQAACNGAGEGVAALLEYVGKNYAGNWLKECLLLFV